MRSLDVSRRLGVIIQPRFPENGVPAPTDELMNDDQNPNGEMIDLIVHKAFSIIPGARFLWQAYSSRSAHTDLT
jgi:hypothetical protein